MDRDARSIAAVVLAAGEARRYGAAKQVVRIDGRPLVVRAVEAARIAGLAPVIVVVGGHADAVRAALDGVESVEIVHNPAHDEGIGTSVAAGMAALGSRSVGGVAFLTCDQVGLDGELVSAVVGAYRPGVGMIVRPVASDGAVAGHPVIFDPRYSAELAALSGAAGGVEIIRRHPSALVEVDVGDPGRLRDLDRPPASDPCSPVDDPPPS